MEEDLDSTVLDELATWLNSRGFADNGKAAVLDDLAPGRKFGLDVFHLMQHINQVDKPVRESFVEHVGRSVRFDKVKIALGAGSLLSPLFGKKWGYLPKFPMTTFRMGTLPTAPVSDRWYCSDKANTWYDTRQVLRADYPRGAHSVLNSRQLVGRFQTPKLTWCSASRRARRARMG